MTTKRTLSGVAIGLLLMLSASELVHAIEQPKFDLVGEVGEVQIRKYQPYVIARTLVTGSFSESGNQGFRRLAGYIFGGNGMDQEIAMTAPVGLQAGVETDRATQYWVTFSMPSEFSLDELPTPDDARVDLVEVPEMYVAVLPYRGNWSEDRYRRHETKLLSLLEGNASWVKQGDPSWSRYDPPFVPWFMRRNEVAIPVAPAARDKG